MEQKLQVQLPERKEIAFRTVYALGVAGGRLSFERVMELLTDHFRLLPEYYEEDEVLMIKWRQRVRYSGNWMKKQGLVSIASEDGALLIDDGDLKIYAAGPDVWELTPSGKKMADWAIRFYDSMELQLPDWASDYLSAIRKRIRGFLRGTGPARPTDIEMCRWVDFCYRTREYDRAVELFTRVLQENVPERIYRVAVRQARICDAKSASGNDETAAPRPEEAQDKVQLPVRLPGKRHLRKRRKSSDVPSHWPSQMVVMHNLVKLLADNGGALRTAEAYSQLGKMFGLSREEQIETMPSGPRHWWNVVQWARQRAVTAGFMKRHGRARGVWEITGKGRAYAEKLGGTTQL